MNRSQYIHRVLVGCAIGLIGLAGCPGPKSDRADVGPRKENVRADKGAADKGKPDTVGDAQQSEGSVSTAQVKDVDAAKKLLDGLGAAGTYKEASPGVLTAIAVSDGSTLTANDIALFGRLTDLESLQLLNFRDLNDEMAAQLAGLKNLQTLALTNSVIGDPTVELIVKSFPNLTSLELSYNANLTNSVLKTICQLSELQRLTLIQTRFNDLGTTHLEKLQKLKLLDLRGNMEAGDLTLEIVGTLPKLVAFKHRSTTVSDYGIEYLAQSKSLQSLLMQDFTITSQAGQYLAKMENLRELEVFRCQGFGTEGVLMLKGLKLTRLQLRDLPVVDDQAMAVFEDLPELQRLYLHENDSISDEGLKSLANLTSLEVLDVWSVSQMGDATVDVIATLPNLKELSIRATSVTDAAVEKIVAMPQLQSLTFKDNAAVSDEALKKLSSRKWSKLDIGQ